MKRIFTLMVAVLMLATCMVTPALAAENTPSVVVEYGDEEIIITDPYTIESASISNANVRAREVYDLGTNNSITLTISDFAANQTRRTEYNYKTNSTKIKVYMKSDIDISVKVTLYDASTDKALNQKTITVGNVLGTSTTFTNLTSASTYYLKFENLGQQDVEITGSISAK